jgi:hypothetical protein
MGSVWQGQEDIDSLRERGNLPAIIPGSAASWYLKLCEELHNILPPSQSTPGEEKDEPSKNTLAFQKIYIASSETCYLRMDGTAAPRTAVPPSKSTSCLIPAHHPPVSSVLGPMPPSLLELCIEACATYPDLNAIEELLIDAPPPLMRALKEAQAAREEGGRECSVCHRNYIIPRTEWIEYWQIMPAKPDRIHFDEAYWPFLRRGCSHNCVRCL